MSRRSDHLARLRAAGVADAAGDLRRLERFAFEGLPEGEQAGWDILEDAVARRAAREPVSKITGRRAFWRHAFEVTADVLDPRPDTETLVEAALADRFERVLDLGTGSGCIVVSLLADRPRARGVGTDLSPAALAVAGRNAARLGVSDRLELRRADWFDGVSGGFDLIVSNPPYIADDEMDVLSPEVRAHEPWLALTPGGDGLGPYRTIAAGAAAHLLPGGRLMVEIGHRQGPDVAAIFAQAGLSGVAVLPDLDGRDRVVTAKCP